MPTTPARRETRALFWNGKYGAAFVGRTHHEFERAPHVPGLDVYRIDYAPCAAAPVAEVWEQGQAQYRRLTPAECAVIDSQLEQMRRGAGNPFERPAP